jgi:hypothetical protein
VPLDKIGDLFRLQTDCPVQSENETQKPFSGRRETIGGPAIPVVSVTPSKRPAADFESLRALRAAKYSEGFIWL